MSDDPTFQLRPVDPVADLDLLHGWVTQDRAEFWGMTDHTREQVGEVYSFLDSLETHHAYLVRRDGEPVAIFQTYEPEHDPLGEHYDVQPGDLGIHLFVAEGERVPGFTGRLACFLLSWVLSDPAVRRIVVEPDARNAKVHALNRRVGFVYQCLLHLPEKDACLAFCTRAQFLATLQENPQ